MPAELIIAPPASGKTQTCIQRIKTTQSLHPLAKIWVLVPDSQKAGYFRRRLAASGGGIGVTVGTFRSLYQEILERNGVFIPVITPALEHRLVQEIIKTAFDNQELAHFAAIKDKPGFLKALQDAFAELRGGLVRPEGFIEYTRTSSPAYRELALLYDRFLAQLQSLNWTDQEGQSWLAISALEKKLKSTKEYQLIVVDGFTNFTGARRQFLKLLNDHVSEMLITLPGKLGSSRQVHRRSQTVIERLQCDLSPNVDAPEWSPHLPADVLHIENHVLDPALFEKRTTTRSLLIEARSQSEEAREALRWIKERIIREGVPITECAVFTSHLDTYRPLIRAAAREFGIKVHFSHPDPLVESPLVLAIFSLLSLPVEGYSTREVFNVLHSPYFDFGLDAGQIEDLEKVSQQAIIVMGRAQWEDAWESLPKADDHIDEDLDEERYRKSLVKDIDLPALRNAFDRFWHSFDSIGEVRSQRDWVEWLESLLDSLHFYEHVSTEDDLGACSSLTDALNALILSESVAGVRQTDFSQMLSDLKGTISGITLDEPRENRKNALLVGGMLEARGSRFKEVALLGFSEGLFPAVENPDPFLDEIVRRDLGLEPRLQREQASVFYQAFTRAELHLLMTRPYLSEDGEAWEPSPYWTAVKQLFTDEALIRIHPGLSRQQADAASPQELLFWGIQQNQQPYPQSIDLSSRWQYLSKAKEILNHRRAKRARGVFDGNVHQIAPYLLERFSTGHIWSASRLEEYGTCPFKFYVSSTLELRVKESPEVGFDASQLGSIVHRILELVYADAAPDEDISGLLLGLENVAKRVFLHAPRVYGFRPSPLWEIEKQRILMKLRETLMALNQLSKGWQPYQFEQKFGKDGLPALNLDLEIGSINIRGVIDRVDRDNRGKIRVIDYKTGGSNLEDKDLKNGRRLQIPIYALAAQETLCLGEVVEGFYWKVNEAKASSFKLSSFNNDDFEGPEVAYSVAREHILRIVNGVQLGDFPPKPPRGGCPSYCPAVQWCWRYQGGFK